MRFFWLCLLIVNLSCPYSIICDEDSNCYYTPEKVLSRKSSVPALIVLQCNGAKRGDLDSFKIVADSLNWVVATCNSSRNHRDIFLNDTDIYQVIKRLVRICPFDSSSIVIYGFSGQGAQAMASLFLHPDLVRGVLAVCAPRIAIRLLDLPLMLINHPIYLVSREEDWNRVDNLKMFEDFKSWGFPCTLLLTKGEHAIGTIEEVFAGCGWLDREMKKD
ncbi:MAG: hypothetical protein ACUVUD_01410 [bacterium]